MPEVKLWNASVNTKWEVTFSELLHPLSSYWSQMHCAMENPTSGCFFSSQIQMYISNAGCQREKIGLKGKKRKRSQCITAAVSYSHRTVISNEKDQGLTCVCNAEAWGLNFILKEKKSCFGNKNEDFLVLGNREDKAAQVSNPPKSTPQSSSPPPCQAHISVHSKLGMEETSWQAA